MRKTFCFIALVMLTAACCNKTAKTQLTRELDSVWNSTYAGTKDDSLNASQLLERVKQYGRVDKQSEAMRNLIAGTVLLRQRYSDTAQLKKHIDNAARYYSHHPEEKVNLVRCMLLKSNLARTVSHDMQLAMKTAKKTEQLAGTLPYPMLQFKACYSIMCIYMEMGDYTYATLYAKKVLTAARQTGRKNLEAAALYHLATCYNKTDEYYAREYECLVQLKELIGLADIHMQPFMLNHIAIVMYDSLENMDEARTLLQLSLSKCPTADAYSLLAMIEARSGKAELAEQLWNKAIGVSHSKPLEQAGGNLAVYQNIADFYNSTGSFEKAARWQQRIILAMDSIATSTQAKAVAEETAKFEHEVKKNHLYTRIAICAMIAIVLAVLLVGTTVVARIKHLRSQKSIMSHMLLIQTYEKQLKEWETTGKANQGEIKELQQKLNLLQKKQVATLHNGYKLYEELRNGGTTVRWQRCDFLDFIEFYRMKDLEFVLHLENDYVHLSPGGVVFEILYHMEYDDSEVRRILGVGASTIRSTRARNKKKRKVTTE